MTKEDFNKLLQLVDDLDHEICGSDCENCSFYQRASGACVMVQFEASLSIKHKERCIYGEI